MRFGLALGVSFALALVACDRSGNKPPGTRCGDGKIQAPEECDDGNDKDTDGCTTQCKKARCGDGVVRAGVESCDDGNAVDGDGCEANCTPTGGQTTVETCDGWSSDPPADGVCTVQAGNESMLIAGTLLIPGKVVIGGQLLVDDQGVIQCAGCGCDEGAGPATTIVCPQGVISPGLINTHDHITFTQNAPGADSGERYEHRHDWRTGKRGHTEIKVPGNATADQIRWGELRFLIGGGTATVGAVGSSNPTGLLRDLDKTAAQEGLATPQVDTDTFPLGDTSGTLIASGCAYPKITTSASIASDESYLPHISEGIDVETRNEFLCTSSATGGGQDLIQAQTAIVHAVGLTPPDYAQMAVDGTALIWSPRSNIRLYGNTAQVTVAQRLGVLIALGTDWTASGSVNMLRELRCADDYNTQHLDGFFSDEQLWRMATINAAQVTASDAKIGSLAVGKLADIAIFDGSTQKQFRAVIAAEPKTVSLVLRGGKPLYGDAALIDALAPSAGCDDLDVCSTPKKVCLMSEIQKSYAQLEASVGAATYAAVYCDVPENEPTCIPSRPESVNSSTTYTGEISGDDSDGDGVPDLDDLCPQVFDPIRPMDNGAQADFDADGLGDACDPCPLEANSTTCKPVDSSDVDGDGITFELDNCPNISNADQADADSDGKGDACDSCPMQANPGSQPCPGTIYQVKDGTIKIGENVAIANVLVTAKASDGFYVQAKMGDAGYMGPQNSALFVFGTGPAGMVKVGDRINIKSGAVQSFKGQLELSGATIEVVTSMSEMPPAAVTESAPGVALTVDDVATGGPLAQKLEGVIVKLSSLTVTDAAPAALSGDMAPTNEFMVGGKLRVDDLFFLITPAPQKNESFEAITGVLIFRNGANKLAPRNMTDVTRALGLIAIGPTGFARVGYTGQTTLVQPLEVLLNGPAKVDTTVNITSSDASLLTLDGAATAMGTVQIQKGDVSATVLLNPKAPGTVTLTAQAPSLTTTSVTTMVTVIAADAPSKLASLTAPVTATSAGATVNFTATLDVPTAANAQVTLTYTGGTGPAMVQVDKDKISATFDATVAADALALSVTASYGGVMKTVTLPLGSLVINEVDYDQDGTDNAEYVEIFNPTGADIDLSNMALIFINGETATTPTSGGRCDFSALAADKRKLPMKSYLVVGPTSLTVGGTVIKYDFASCTGSAKTQTNAIQNGARDAVALIDRGNMAMSILPTVIDVITWEGHSNPFTLSIDGQNLTINTVEGTETTASDPGMGASTLCRSPNGIDTNNQSVDWKRCNTVTPGAGNQL